MFHPTHKPRTTFGITLTMAELIYHSIVRSVRRQHNDAFMALQPTKGKCPFLSFRQGHQLLTEAG